MYVEPMEVVEPTNEMKSVQGRLKFKYDTLYDVSDPRVALKMPLKLILFCYNIAGLIRAEENRILFEMCQTISQNRAEIKDAVTAIAEIDVFRAKAKVGARMRGIIPEVRTS
jgi:hypothetical protein